MIRGDTLCAEIRTLSRQWRGREFHATDFSLAPSRHDLFDSPDVEKRHLSRYALAKASATLCGSSPFRLRDAVARHALNHRRLARRSASPPQQRGQLRASTSDNYPAAKTHMLVVPRKSLLPSDSHNEPMCLRRERR